MAKIIIEIDDKLKSFFKITLFRERKTAKKVLTDFIIGYVNKGKRK